MIHYDVLKLKTIIGDAIVKCTNKNLALSTLSNTW